MIRPEQYMISTQVFPELADFSNEYRFIDFMIADDMKIFVKECLNHANYKLNDKDLLLCHIVCDTLIKKGILGNDNHQTFVDVILAACMLHRTYWNDYNKVVSLVMPRNEFYAIGKSEELYEYGPLPGEVLEPIFQTIEAQLGELTPIQFCKPNCGSYQELFANCVSIVDNLDTIKEYMVAINGN